MRGWLCLLVMFVIVMCATCSQAIACDGVQQLNGGCYTNLQLRVVNHAQQLRLRNQKLRQQLRHNAALRLQLNGY